MAALAAPTTRPASRADDGDHSLRSLRPHRTVMPTPSRLARRTIGALLVVNVVSGCASGAGGSGPSAGGGEPVKTNASIRTTVGYLRGVPGSRPGVRAYLGIPYAAPPVGERRWRSPAPPIAWTNVRSASAFGPSCM